MTVRPSVGEQPGRRERKKAATRRTIADAALGLFLERGYDAVGIREVATAADVAVTTLFAHFPSKEALVFERDADFERELVSAAADLGPGEPLIPALRRQVRAMVRYCSAPGTAAVWTMIDATPALREYEELMRRRHAESLAAAIARMAGADRSVTACRAVARFVLDAYFVARSSDRPMASVDEMFLMIDAAWAAGTRQRNTVPRGGGAPPRR